MKVKYLGQSGFMLQSNSSSFLIDPGKKENGNILGDTVFVTQKHSDHTGGVEIFLKRNSKAVLICNEQVAKNFSKWEDRIIQVEPGEEIQHSVWTLRFIKGHHGLFSGVQNTGVIVQTSNLVFGHIGDSVDFRGFYQEKMCLV